MSNDAIPFFEKGDRITGTATADVTGKTLVKISGNVQSDGTYSVAPAGAGDIPIGVAAWDAKSGARVTVYALSSGFIVPVTGSGAIAANARVKVIAGGKVSTAADGDVGVGLAMTAAADGDDAQIKLGFVFVPSAV